jgi:4'-phosphopantetheinyl transferase EntD
MMHLNEANLACEVQNEFEVALKVAISSESIARDRLTSNELERLSELRTSPRRVEWLKGRSAFKRLLNSLGEDEETATIGFPNSRFSLTHSGGFAVALGTVSEELRGIGVDLELNRSVRLEVARFFLSEPEREWLMCLDEATRPKHLLRLWTIKEAVFKSDPQNSERWFTDYRIAPAELRGRAFVSSDKAIEFRYSCFELEEGFLSVAVLPRRQNVA